MKITMMELFAIFAVLTPAVSGFVAQGPADGLLAQTSNGPASATNPFNTPMLTHQSTQLFAQDLSSTGDEATYIDPDFRLSAIFLGGGLLLDQLPFLKWTLGPIVTLLGVLFLVQTFRLKFVCDSTSFELLNTSQESGENIVVGGENRWSYGSFVNYDFFPKGWIDQPQGPILVCTTSLHSQSLSHPSFENEKPPF